MPARRLHDGSRRSQAWITLCAASNCTHRDCGIGAGESDGVGIGSITWFCRQGAELSGGMTAIACRWQAAVRSQSYLQITLRLGDRTK